MRLRFLGLATNPTGSFRPVGFKIKNSEISESPAKNLFYRFTVLPFCRNTASPFYHLTVCDRNEDDTDFSLGWPCQGGGGPKAARFVEEAYSADSTGKHQAQTSVKLH
jgi:hypothetical protein